MKEFIKTLIAIAIVVGIHNWYAYGDSGIDHDQSCKELYAVESSVLASRNTINNMNKEHSSDAMQSALNNADDALDILQAKLNRECPVK